MTVTSALLNLTSARLSNAPFSQPGDRLTDTGFRIQFAPFGMEPLKDPLP